jgi:hypothetical protein
MPGRAPGQTPAARRAPLVVDQAKVPNWQKADVATLEGAAKEERPIVLYFADEADSDFAVYGDEVTALSKDNAVFIKFAHNADREKSPWAADSIVPVNKLLTDNPAREYNVPVGKATMVVCDWYGNEYFRPSSHSNADQIKRFLDQVGTRADGINKKLEKKLTKAQKSHEKKDVRRTIKDLKDNFETGLYGLPAQESSVKLYREIMQEGRDKLATLVEKGDSDGIKGLMKDFNDTELEKEPEEALKNPVTQAKAEK